MWVDSNKQLWSINSSSTTMRCKNCILSILHYIPSRRLGRLKAGARIIYDGLFSLQNRAAEPSFSLLWPFLPWPEILVHYVWKRGHDFLVHLGTSPPKRNQLKITVKVVIRDNRFNLAHFPSCKRIFSRYVVIPSFALLSLPHFPTTAAKKKRPNPLRVFSEKS